MNKVALVTGASAGIGKAIAIALLQQGYVVYGAARRVARMQELEQPGMHLLAMDITQDTSVVTGINRILEEQGRIDVLVNNAGFGLYGAIEDVNMEDARYQMEVNVIGLARLTQLVIPAMRQQHSGKIVNITSVAGKVVSPFGGWYHASKFAVEALSDALRLEVQPFGIDVIVIEPGGIQSEWNGIAMDNLKRTSGQGVYAGVVTRVKAAWERFNEKSAAPEVIAGVVLKAISAVKPKTRYHAGYLAGFMLMGRKLLTDRQLDRILLHRMKKQ